jgi:hypothetical protein
LPRVKSSLIDKHSNIAQNPEQQSNIGNYAIETNSLYDLIFIDFSAQIFALQCSAARASFFLNAS